LVICDWLIGDKEEATSSAFQFSAFCFLLSAFPPLHKERAREAVIDQGTKSKRIGAKSAEDFAEKNSDDLYRALIAPTENSALSSARSASPRFAETVILPHWQLDLASTPATQDSARIFS
jgi:hypothetical protein